MIDRRRPRRVRRRRAGRAGQGRRHPRRPRRRLRAAQRQRPPRQRARHLRARDRRLPARPLQDLLRGRVRRADLRRGPRPDPELRGRRQRRLRAVPRRRSRDRRPARHEHLPGLPLQPGDPLLRLPPQPGGYSGTDGNADARRPQQLLRQRARLHDRRLHRRRPPGLPAGLRPDREQQLLLQQLQPLPGKAPTSTPPGAAAGRHRAVDRRRQRRRRPQQPLLRQLAARHDAVRGARTAGLRPDRHRAHRARRLQPDRRAALDVLPQPVLRQRHGYRAGGAVQPNGNGDLANGRTDFWWDDFLGNTGNCWHDNIGKDGTPSSVTSTPLLAAAALEMRQHEHRHGRSQQEAELLNCFADITFESNACPWFTTPSKPQ